MSRLQWYWNKFFLMLHGKSVRGSEIDSTAKINYGSNVVDTKMGRYSYCGYDCWIIDAEIGSFCSISNNVRIGGPAHPIDWISTSPVFHEGKNIFNKHFSEHKFVPTKRTYIGNDVWIGENALIKSGISIADGAVIGMGSVVTHNVGAYEIWAGNPAKRIDTRFSPDEITRLIESKWWNKDEEKIAEMSKHFNCSEKAWEIIK